MQSLRKMGIFILGVLAFDLAASAVRTQDTGTSGQSPAPAEHHDSSQRGSGMSVRHAQQVLKDKGYYKAEVDGKYGPETRAALQKYQQDENLTVNGRLDRQTAVRLGPGKGASTTAGTPIQGAKSAAKEGYSEAKETVTTGVKQDTKEAGSAVKEGLGAVKGNSKTKKAPKREQ
ncbi:MAG: peptidoglycan-binding domain-containing protein [Bryobacteraceae bacterium]